MRNWDVTTLDPTGATIPSTYHSPQDTDGAVFMAANGDDKNDGKSEMSPVKSLNRAVAQCPNKGSINIRGGTYNDNYRNPDGSFKIMNDKFITVQSYLGEPVTFDGGGKLKFLMVCGAKSGTGETAFKGFEITGFIGDWGGSIGNVPLYLGDGSGAVYAVEDLLVHKNSGCGINVSDPRGDLGDARVVRTVFCDNGSDGLTDTGSQKAVKGSGPRADHDNDWWVMHSYFGRNNRNNNQKPYEAGSKVHNNRKVTFFGNIVEDTIGNYGHGLWSDVANIYARYIMNCVRGCGSDGLFDEVGEEAWFISNLVIDCGLEENHANIRVASRKPMIWYNTSVVTREGRNGKKAYLPIEIYDDVRNNLTDGYGADTRDVSMSSNLFSGRGRYSFLMWLYANQPPHAGGGTQPSDFWTPNGHWGPNAWWLDGANMVRWTEKGTNVQYKDPASLQKARGVGGKDIICPDEPFVDHKRFRVKSTSPAYGLGEPLPADVAALLGYKAGQRFPFGYIDCPIPRDLAA